MKETLSSVSFRSIRRGRAQGMLSDRRGIGAAIDRQHVGQQLGGGGIGHERGPPGLQIEAFGRDVVGD